MNVRKQFISCAPCLVGLALISGVAFADTDFVKLTANKDFVLLVLPSSIRVDKPGSSTIWMDIRLASRAKFFNPKTRMGNRYAVEDHRWIVDCNDPGKFKDIEVYFRDGNGQTVESYQRTADAAMTSNAGPGSMASIAVSYGCANIPRAVADSSANEGTPKKVSAGSSGNSDSSSESKPEKHDVSGTSFAVSSTGHLLTNNHVVRDCDDVQIYNSDGRKLTARVSARDERNDLALLASDTPLPTYARFRSEGIKSGENVIALGFPYRGLLATDVNVSTGIVSAMAGIRNNTAQIQISAPVQPGNSGGPLLDANGWVAGVVVAKLDALVVAKVIGDVPQNINFAIKGELAKTFLQSNGVQPMLSPSKPKAGLVADIVENSRGFVYLVECHPKD